MSLRLGRLVDHSLRFSTLNKVTIVTVSSHMSPFHTFTVNATASVTRHAP